MSLSSDILEILEKDGRMSWSAIGIYNVLYGRKTRDIIPSEKRKIIKKINTSLKRLTDRKKINRKTRGFYQAKPLPHVIEKLENPSVCVHGIKLEIKIVENNTKGMVGIPPQSNIFGDWLDARGFEAICNNRWSLVRWWENRKITFIFHVSGLVEVFVNASSFPLGFLDFDRLLIWFNGFFDPLLFDHGCTFVRQIGFNRDFRLLRLDGVKSVSLKVVRNLWHQVYQKEGFVRFETHAVFPEMCVDVDAVVRGLGLLTSSVSVGNGHSVDYHDDWEVG